MDQLKNKLSLLKAYPQEALLIICIVAIGGLSNYVLVLTDKFDKYTTEDRVLYIKQLDRVNTTLERTVDVLEKNSKIIDGYIDTVNTKIKNR